MAQLISLATILLIWIMENPLQAERFGIWSSIVDISGELVAPSVQIFNVQYDPNAAIGIHPGRAYSAVQNTNGEFLLGLSISHQPGKDVDGYLVRLNQRGHRIARTAIPVEGDLVSVNPVQLKKGLFLVSFMAINTPDISIYNRMYRGNLKPKGAPYDPLPDRSELFGSVVKLGADKGAYDVAISGGQFWGQYISRKGKPDGEAVKIAGGAGKARSLIALAVPGSNQVIVIWENKRSAKASEIRALVFAAR